MNGMRVRWLVLALVAFGAGAGFKPPGVKVPKLPVDPEIVKTANELKKAFERDYRSDEEYFLGRTVAVSLLANRNLNLKSIDVEGGPYEDAEVTAYVDLLGLSLTGASDRPQLFQGYSFQVLDTDGIAAWSTPGGHCFLARGAIEACDSEDALAGILAHEVAHVELRHIVKELKSAGKRIAGENFATSVLKDFDETESIAKTVDGVAGEAVNFIIEKGYSREQELEADARAIEILQRVGYDPHAFLSVLREVNDGLIPDQLDFVSSHPTSEDRLANLEAAVADIPVGEPSAARRERYERIVRIVREGG